MLNEKNIEDKINAILSQITEKDLENAREFLETEDYLNYICKEYDLCFFYDEYSNDFEN